jgi:chromatin remodeling complex protein RSC6
MANKAFMKPVEVSEALARIVGSKKQPRTQITKKVWAYIKKHDLQDCDNKRVIVPDDCLGDVIGHRPIDMMKMTKKISEHIYSD